MKEIWKDIPGFEGVYQASNTGHIKTLERVIIMKNGVPRTIKEKVMKERQNNRGYHMITLKDSNNDSKDFLVHRLIAITFLPNPNNLPQVNHKDGNKSNNSVDNLEWCDQSHNMKESYKLGLREVTLPEWTEERKAEMSKRNKGVRKTSQMKKVARLDSEGNIIDVFSNAEEACKTLGYKDKTSIYDCCTGRKNRKTYMGYRWKYIEEEQE